jgi:hypothetical protein
MKAPRYINLTTEYKDGKLYANIKIKRWWWSLLYLQTVRPARWYNIPQWIAGWAWITVKGLAGKMQCPN